MARDLIHDAVKQALINDQWNVTEDPFDLPIMGSDKDFEVDLGAEKLLSAEKGMKKILVEVKSFLGTSILYKFHESLGQYLNYSEAIAEGEFDRTLYVGISDTVYEEMKKISFLERRIVQYQIKFVVVNIATKTIVKWIE
jgi:hypothetical protein